LKIKNIDMEAVRKTYPVAMEVTGSPVTLKFIIEVYINECMKCLSASEECVVEGFGWRQGIVTIELLSCNRVIPRSHVIIVMKFQVRYQSITLETQQ